MDEKSVDVGQWKAIKMFLVHVMLKVGHTYKYKHDTGESNSGNRSGKLPGNFHCSQEAHDEFFRSKKVRLV